MSSFPLSASVVSVEDMDRQPLSSPEGKKVSYLSLQRAVVLFDQSCSRSRRCQNLFGARRGTRRTPASYELRLPGRRGSRF